MLPIAYRHCLFTVTVSFYVCDDGGGGGGVCVCMEWLVFIAIAWDETSNCVAVHFSMNIYQLCDRGRVVMWSNVGVSQ